MCFDPLHPSSGTFWSPVGFSFTHQLPFSALFLLYKLPIVPLAIRWPWFNVLKNFSLQPSWLFIRPGKNKSSTCNYSLSGSTHCGVSSLGLRSGSWLMEYDLEPLRETQPSDLTTDGRAQAPVKNFFSFSSSGMGRETGREMTGCDRGSFLGGQRVTWEFFFFNGGSWKCPRG